MKKISIPFFLFTILLLSVGGDALAREHAPITNQINPTEIQTHGSELLDLLRSQQFDALDHRLNALQMEYEKDTERELDVATAFDWFSIPDPDLENLFQEWLKAYPESYAANLAQGIYYFIMAAHWRGEKYFGETHPFRIERMERYLDKAVVYLEKSLRLTKEPTISYAKLIATARYLGDDELSNRWLTEALKSDPYCIKPRRAYMRSLEPRWGGSYEAMRKFAEDTRKGEHSKMEKAARLIEAWIHFDKGYQKHLEGNYVATLDEYQKAIAIEDDSWFRSSRAKIYQIVGQTDLSMADLNRALELDPSSTEALYMRGVTLLDKRQPIDALKDLHMAAEHGDMDAAKKLGDLYTTGDLGVPLNVAEGMKWWARAAYFWDEYACDALAKTYERGLGVPENKATAVKYYRIAADQGYGPAINDLGLMIWYGQGTPANKEEAVQLWIIGAQKNIWQSKHNLQFFLSPLERLKLAVRYPRLFVNDKVVIWMATALSLVLVLIVTLLVIVVVRMAKTRQKTEHGTKEGIKMATISQNQGVREQNVLGLPVDRNIIFSNHKGTYKQGIEKRQTKLFQEISFIKPFLKEDEKIILVTTGCSPMSIMEQLLTGWIVFYLKRSLFVFTNKRIFHIPTKINYSYRNSIAQVLYADCQTIKTKGRTLVVKYKNEKKEKFYYIGRKERKKIKALLKTVSLEGVQSKTAGRVHLCPRCTKELTENEYTCPNCRLEFKSKDEAKRISLIYPGGGYFYTGHPWLGIGDAITESILLLVVVLSFVDALQGANDGFASFVVFSILLALEKVITVYHSNHFIKEYIPKEKEIKPIATSK